jgi:flagellar biosynthesis protein FlhA
VRGHGEKRRTDDRSENGIGLGTRTRMTLSRIARRVCPQAIVLALSELPPTSNLEFYKVLCAQTGKNP